MGGPRDRLGLIEIRSRVTCMYMSCCTDYESVVSGQSCNDRDRWRCVDLSWLRLKVGV